MELRPYQIEAKEAIFRQWSEGTQRTLLILPTGCGKTIVFASVIREMIETGKRCLILAHREELLNQAADKIERTTGLKSALEKAESTALDSWFNITVGSVQTLQNKKRLERFPRDYYDCIVIDEAHHAISPSYRTVIDYFDRAKLLGVTATADRGDKRNLGEVFDKVAYEYTLRKAILSGYLAPIKALTIPVRIDLAGVKTQAGDFQASALGGALDPYLYAIADSMLEYCRDRKTVVFLPLIATSQKFCRILNEKGLRAGEVNGESGDRAEKLADFHNGKYQVLCNSMLLTEGWDEPAVDCIVILRPTKIRGLYCQMVGRGTRIFPGKRDLLILDFLWLTEKHDLCRPAHLVCRNEELTGRVAELMTAASEQTEVDLLEISDKLENNAESEREEALKRELEAQKKRKRNLVDPLQYEMSISSGGKCMEYQDDPNDLKAMMPPTAKQLAELEKRGIFPDEIKTQGHASAILDTLAKRRMEGLATPRQIRKLEKYGFVNVGMWSFESANSMMCRVAANSWYIPQGINPKTYIPNDFRVPNEY